MSFNLNRLHYFGNNKQFPRIILKALVHTCGASVTIEQIIEREKDILNFVKNFKSYVSEDFDNIESKEDYIKIATFLGSLEGWKNKENLLTSFKDIIVFHDSLDVESIIKKYGELKISYKKNDKLYSLDILMAYKYCLENNIKIEIDDGVLEIENKIRDFLESKNTKNLLIQDLEKVEKIEDSIKVEKIEDSIKVEKIEDSIKVEKIDILESRINSYIEILKDKENKILEKDNEILNLRNLENKILEKDKEILNLRNLENKILEKDKEILNLKNLEKNSFNITDNSPHSKLYKNFLDNLEKPYNLESIKSLMKSSILNLMISKSLLSNEESIFIALRIHNFDLRDSPSIYLDLLDLNEARKNKNDYYPSKERKDIFARNLFLNKNYYSTTHYYNPELKEFYNQKTLELLYSEYNINSLEELKEFYKNNNFHRGWLQGDIISVYENRNLKNSKHNTIISFGVPGQKIVNFNVDELTLYLKNKGNIDPISNKPLTNESLKGLKNICNNFKDHPDYIELLKSIHVKNLSDNNNIKIFVEKYIFASDLIIKVLDHLFRIGMFMRGWRINNTGMCVYPLKKKDTLEYLTYKDSIDINIRRVVHDFNNDLEKIHDISIRNNIKRLPLVYYSEDFIYNNKYSNLLELVTSLDNLNSIRDVNEISNLFILSAYYYTNISTGKKLFSIDSLELL